MLTDGFSAILIIVLLLAGFEGSKATEIVASAVMCVEQVISLIMFMTYEKATQSIY